MNAKMSVPEDMKTKIRSVLLSKVGGIKLSELNRDYKKLVGQPIMYKKLGFSNVESLIESIPDVARIKPSPDGDRVYGVLNNPNIMNHTARKAQYRPDHEEDKPVLELEQQSDTLKWQKELQPNLKGLYCLCMPKQPSLSRETVNTEFSKYGEVKETSYTERYVFVRFAQKEHALAALEELSVKYDVRIPTEKNNPRRVIKEKDVTGEMPPYPTVKATNDRILKPADVESQLEVFVGNLPLSTTQGELEKLVSEFQVLNMRIRGNEGKRFAFLLVPNKSECDKIVKKLHRVTFKDRLLIAQASYETPEKRTAKENKVILQTFVKGGLEGTTAVAKPVEDADFVGSHDDLPELERCEWQDGCSSFETPEPRVFSVNCVQACPPGLEPIPPQREDVYKGKRFDQHGNGWSPSRYGDSNQRHDRNRRNYNTTSHAPPWAGGQMHGQSIGRGQGQPQSFDGRPGGSIYSQYQERNMYRDRIGEPRVTQEKDNSIAELVSQIELEDQDQRHKKAEPLVVGSGMGDLQAEERVFELYCSGFPYGTNPGELFHVFQPYGASHVKVKNNNPGAKTYAFIVFNNYEDASDAFTNLDGQEFNGRLLNISFGKRSVIDDRDLAKKMGNLKCTVMLANGEDKREVKLETSKKHPRSSQQMSSSQHHGNMSQHAHQASQQHSSNPKTASSLRSPQFSERLGAGDQPVGWSEGLNRDSHRHSPSKPGFTRHNERGAGDHRGQKSQEGRGNGQRGGWAGHGENKGVGLGRGTLLSSIKQQPPKPERQRSRNDSWETVSNGSAPSLPEKTPDLTPPPIPEDSDIMSPLATVSQQEEVCVPHSMKQDRLSHIYQDCFPEVGFPDLSVLQGRLCVIPRVEESSGYFWGQLMSENMSATLELVLQIAQSESKSLLNPCRAESKRAAAFFEGEWYRVWVEDIVADLARVFFVDWGNVETLPMSDLRELPPEFWRCQPSALPFKLDDHDNVGELMDQQVEVQIISCQDPLNVVAVSFLDSHTLEG